ncbi:MAG: uracil-DNA glycosylase [Victivallaceae bacterium]
MEGIEMLNNVPPQMDPHWAEILSAEWEKPYMSSLRTFLLRERRGPIPIYPEAREVFSAFTHTSFEKTQVIIMGQDPYSGPNQAHGLSFSVKPGILCPPSLKNIFLELQNDLEIQNDKGCLIPWAKQGVLLLNSVCTVRKDSPRSHAGKGWEIFTDAVIGKFVERKDPVIFVLWGSDAKKKCEFVTGRTHHFVLTAAHPSPLAAFRGFFGCSHFSKINFLLKKQNKAEIDWRLV